MINILTLKVGSKYGPEYVNRLYRGIARNTSVPFRFFCYTEDGRDLIPEVAIIRLRPDSRVVRQWYKLDFHCPRRVGLPLGAKCLILDLDQIVLGNLDEVLNWPIRDDEAGLVRRWWSGTSAVQCELNGGFQMYHLGATEHLYLTFLAEPAHWQRHYIAIGHAQGPVNGEQNFVNEHLRCRRSWLPDEWFGKYHQGRMDDIERWFHRRLHPGRVFDGERFHQCFKMIHFANSDNMMGSIHEPWIARYWHD